MIYYGSLNSWQVFIKGTEYSETFKTADVKFFLKVTCQRNSQSSRNNLPPFPFPFFTSYPLSRFPQGGKAECSGYYYYALI